MRTGLKTLIQHQWQYLKSESEYQTDAGGLLNRAPQFYRLWVPCAGSGRPFMYLDCPRYIWGSHFFFFFKEWMKLLYYYFVREK